MCETKMVVLDLVGILNPAINGGFDDLSINLSEIFNALHKKSYIFIFNMTQILMLIVQ